jgi:hypothetical protein
MDVGAPLEADSAGPSPGGDGAAARDSFSCNICFEEAAEPVVTQCVRGRSWGGRGGSGAREGRALATRRCGHLYCWPCLYEWMARGNPTCPVCKAGVTRDNVVPIYGRGVHADTRRRASAADAADASIDESGAAPPTPAAEGDIPRRPTGHRPPEPAPARSRAAAPPHAAMTSSMHVSVGFGLFPSLFGLQFQTFYPAASPSPSPATTQGHVPAPAQAQAPGAVMPDDPIVQEFISHVLSTLVVLLVSYLLFV